MIKVTSIINSILNPGQRLVLIHRASYKLYKNKYFKWLALLLWNFEVTITSCHISIKCNLPRCIEFPHPTGIVIGDGVKLGSKVTIYQNVTLGIRNASSSLYPEIKSNAIIYAGAIVVGCVCIDEKASVSAGSLTKA